MTDLMQLAERCEQAAGPDGTLNEEISRAVGTWQPPDRGDPYGTAKPYTASLDVAMTLVPEGWDRAVGTRRGKPYAYTNNGQSHFVGVAAKPNPDLRWFDCKAATEALALCAATLRARAA